MSRTTRTISPPEELAGAEVIALVLPFGEAVDPAHEDRGRVYEWGDVELPRKPVPLREEHDGRPVGWLHGFVQDRRGVWAEVRPGKTAASLFARGVTALSAEIDGGAISGASLVTVPGERPAFASAGVLVDGQRLESEGPLRVGLDPRTGWVVVRPLEPSPDPSPPSYPAADMGAFRTKLDAFSMAFAEAEAARDHERWRLRQVELAEAPALEEEQRLIAAAVPMNQWPVGTEGRRHWDDLVATQRHQAAARRWGAWGRLLALQAAAAAAVPPPRRRRWWRWWK